MNGRARKFRSRRHAVVLGVLQQLALATVLASAPSLGQVSDGIPADLAWSERMALSAMQRAPDPRLLDSRQPQWEYTNGLMLLAIDRVRQATDGPEYLRYQLAYYDRMIAADGSIPLYDVTAFNLDRINPGRVLFSLYATTGDEKYRKAIDTIREQLDWQPRTLNGGFWHKLVYPYQMWLDGAYMALPFYARYAAEFGDASDFADVVHQVVEMDRHMRDDTTGLLYHGWDESRLQRWSNSATGTSSQFWGRAMGWYAMSLVDILDFLPREHPGRPQVTAILSGLATALERFQDPETGLWYQVVDQAGREGNYLEASASSMFAYAMAKGARLGVIDPHFRQVAERAFDGILSELVAVDADGEVHLTRICIGAGLGGNPYRDGSYDYYVNERVGSDDPKGVGPFILASLELGR